MRNWLLRKLTREQLAHFLQDKGTDEIVLEVGASYRPQKTLYPASVSGDVLLYPELDVQFDAHHMPFANKSFYGIVCIEVLEHCHSPHRVIQECHRLLKDGGHLILSTRFVFPIHDAPHDYYRYTKYGLSHLLKDFSSVEIQAEAKTVVTIGVLLQRLAYQADWHIPFTKIILLLMAKLMPLLQSSLAKEYGDVRKSVEEETILPKYKILKWLYDII